MTDAPDEVYYLDDADGPAGKRLYASDGTVRESYSLDDAEIRLYRDELMEEWYAKIGFEDSTEEARERLADLDDFVAEEYDTDFHPSFRRFDRKAGSDSLVRQRCRVGPLKEVAFCYSDEDRFDDEAYPEHINRVIGGAGISSLAGYGATGAAAGTLAAGPGGFVPGLMGGVMTWYAEVEAQPEYSPISLMLKGLEKRYDAKYSLQNEDLFDRWNASIDDEGETSGILRDDGSLQEELADRVAFIDTIQFDRFERREGSTVIFHAPEYEDAAGFVDAFVGTDLPDEEPGLHSDPEAVDAILARLDTDGRRELVGELMATELDEEVATVLDETYGEAVEAVGVETML